MKLPLNRTGKILQKALNFPLKLQLMIIYGVFIGGLTLFSCLLINAEISESNQHQADVIGDLMSRQTASAAGNMLVTGDRLSLSVLLNQLVRNPYISQASIYTIDDRRMGHAESKGVSGSAQEGPAYSAPISYQDVIAGYVRLSLNQKLLTQKPREAVRAIVILSVLLLLSGLVLLFFYGEKLGKRLLRTERQLVSILPEPSQLADPLPKCEITRLATLVEHQLTEKNKKAAENEDDKPTEEVTAVICVRAKNMARLQQLLAPRELMDIIRLQLDIATEAAEIYGGELNYSPEGNGYIRFSSIRSDNFVMDALSCGLLIESLSQRMQEQSIAKIQTGIGFSLTDQLPEQSESNHPALTDNAASQSLMLASLPEPDGLHMLRKQLSWLPADITGIQVSEHGDDIVLISEISEAAAEAIEQEANALEAQWLE